MPERIAKTRFERVNEDCIFKEDLPPKKRVRAKRPRKDPQAYQVQARARFPYAFQEEADGTFNRYSIAKGRVTATVDAALHQACLTGLFQGVQMVENLCAVFQYHLAGLEGVTEEEKQKIRKNLKANVRELKKRIARGDFALT